MKSGERSAVRGQREAGRGQAMKVRAALRLARCAWICAALAGASIVWPADAAERRFDLTVVNGALPAAQRSMRVEKGDLLRWRIVSDVPGELHLHAYRVEAKVTAGVPAELTFTAHATGRFRVEWHAVVDKAGGNAGDKAGGKAAPSSATRVNPHHHAPPLATLEVRPK